MRRLDGSGSISDVLFSASPLHEVLHITTDTSGVGTDISVNGVDITASSRAAVTTRVLVVSKPGLLDRRPAHSNGVFSGVRLTNHSNGYFSACL